MKPLKRSKLNLIIVVLKNSFHGTDGDGEYRNMFQSFLLSILCVFAIIFGRKVKSHYSTKEKYLTTYTFNMYAHYPSGYERDEISFNIKNLSYAVYQDSC